MQLIVELWRGFLDELTVLGIAAIPVLELRGAIPWGILSLKMDWRLVYILSVLGNLIPIPFIIIYLRPLFSFLRETKYFQGFIHWLEKRTMKKADTVLKYSALGLFIFVALPLPGTGAWTGAMIAALLDMRMRYALPAIISGVIVAGVLVTSAVMGGIHLF